jgi:DNA-binding transcriptional MerR regulator
MKATAIRDCPVKTEAPDDLGPAGVEGRDAAVIAIGRLAREFGITVRSLRFYESLGLLRPRREGVARRYSQDDHDRLALILHGKKLGFTLREIRALIASQEAAVAAGEQMSLRLSRAQCVEQINLLERQKSAIESALAELRRTYSSLYTRTLAAAKPEAGDGGGENAA